MFSTQNVWENQSTNVSHTEKESPTKAGQEDQGKVILAACLIISFTFRREELGFLVERNSSAQKKTW